MTPNPPAGADVDGTSALPTASGSDLSDGSDLADVFVGAAVQSDAPVDGAQAGASGLTMFNDPTIPAASSSVPQVAGDPLGDLARGVIEAAEDALAAVAKLWADPPSPGIGTPGADGGIEPTAAVGLLQTSLSWYTAAIAVVAVLIAAGRMAWLGRGQPAAALLRGLGTLVLVTGAAVTAVALFVGAADAFSVWVLDQATDDVEASFVNLLALPDAAGMPVVLTILLGSAVMLGAVLQVVLLIARGAVLVILTGVLPLTASAAGTDTGRAVFVRTLTWVAAFALYQPVAAMIYATAFLVAPNPDDSPVVAALTGTTFLALALAAMPALLRVLRPVVTMATAGGRGTPAGGQLPSGARTVSPVTLAGGASVLRGSGSAAGRPTAAAIAGARPVRTAPRAIAGSMTYGAADGRSAADRRPLYDISVGEVVPPKNPAARPAIDGRPLPGARPGAEDVSP